MSKYVVITLTSVGSSNGNSFNLFSDVDTYATPFESNVLKSDLLTGYTSYLVPDSALKIKVQSVLGGCGLQPVDGMTIQFLIPTPTPTPSITPSVTPSITPTRTLTPTPSITPTITATITPTNTITPTVTPTNTITPSITPTNTITPSITPTNTITPSITPTITPSSSPPNFTNDGKIVLAISTTNELFVSGDYGDSWTQVYLPSNYPVNDACISSNGAIMYVATNVTGGILKSINGGYSWTQVFTTGNMETWGSIDCDSSGTYVGAGQANNFYTGNAFQYYYSTDGGTNWSGIDRVPGTSTDYEAVYVQNVVNKINGWPQYSVAYPYYAFPLTGYQNLGISNNGERFSAYLTGNTNTRIVTSFNNNIQMVGIKNSTSFEYSSNAGSTFTTKSITGPTGEIDFDMNYDGADIIAWGSGNGLWRSTDFGDNWTNIKSNINPVDAVNSGLGQYIYVATGSTGTYVSKNFGSTFILSPLTNDIKIIRTNKDTGSYPAITPTPTRTPTITPTSSITPTRTVTPTITPTSTPTAQPTSSPTPTNTITPTMTVTPSTSTPCFGYNLTPVFDTTCDASGPEITAYKTTGGSLEIGDILRNSCGGSTLATGFYSDGTYRYVVNVGEITNKIACSVTPTPTPSITPTSSITPTPTITPSPCLTYYELAECSPGVGYAFTLIVPDLGVNQRYVLPSPETFYLYTGANSVQCTPPAGYNASIQKTTFTNCP